jgi:RsiW-degrading membrane proteinase PrsW (M82 family)
VRIIVSRNKQDFGPYTLAVAQQYLSQGTLLSHDLARDASNPGSLPVPLAQFLASQGMATPSASMGNPFTQAYQNLRSFDLKLLFPWSTISSSAVFKDRRLIYLAAIGLGPAIALAIAPAAWVGYWALAIYFSVIWALFFYHLFKTPEMIPKTCVQCFLVTGFVSIPVLLILQRIPPWTVFYQWADSGSVIPRFFGMFFGVGISEELCKAAIIFWLVRRPGVLLLPQTVVFYAMISGLGFGICEGVAYQMTLNRKQGIDDAYFLNVARLTSLPFIHAVWAGLAGYFISLAVINARKRFGLWVLAICVPAFFHAVYNTFGWGLIGLGGALLSVILLSTYLTTVQQMHQQLSRP